MDNEREMIKQELIALATTKKPARGDQHKTMQVLQHLMADHYLNAERRLNVALHILLMPQTPEIVDSAGAYIVHLVTNPASEFYININRKLSALMNVGVYCAAQRRNAAMAILDIFDSGEADGLNPVFRVHAADFALKKTAVNGKYSSRAMNRWVSEIFSLDTADRKTAVAIIDGELKQAIRDWQRPKDVKALAGFRLMIAAPAAQHSSLPAPV